MSLPGDDERRETAVDVASDVDDAPDLPAASQLLRQIVGRPDSDVDPFR